MRDSLLARGSPGRGPGVSTYPEPSFQGPRIRAVGVTQLAFPCPLSQQLRDILLSPQRKRPEAREGEVSSKPREHQAALPKDTRQAHGLLQNPSSLGQANLSLYHRPVGTGSEGHTIFLFEPAVLERIFPDLGFVE